MSENQNRAFMYGESVFTTMKMISGTIQDWDHHFDRLRQGVEFVFGPFTDGDNWAPVLRDRLEEKLIQDSGDKILRLVIYRDGLRGQLRQSLISSIELHFSVLSNVYEPGLYHRGLKLRTCPAIMRPHWWPPYLKAGNYFETILAQKIYMKDDDDDLLFLSSIGEVLESSIANIFIVRHNHLYTAPPGPNVLQGIMRRKVLEAAPQFFSKVIQCAATYSQIMKADAVFGTNTVRGPFLIQKVDDKEFKYDQNFLEMFESLRRKVSA